MRAGGWGGWGREGGGGGLAAECQALAEKAHESYDAHFSITEERLPLHRFVATKVASRRRTAAIWEAHDGKPRPEVLKIWEGLARIPYHDYHDEAWEMIRGYRNLIEEDRTWVEPSGRTLDNKPPDERVAYWLYRLRDVDAGQTSDPGMCDVLNDFPFILVGTEFVNRQGPNPAAELKNLGMAALPQIIAHL